MPTTRITDKYPTARMLAVEQHYGKALRELVLELYVQHRTMHRVAKAFGISRASLWTWCHWLGLSQVDLELAVLQADHPLSSDSTGGE